MGVRILQGAEPGSAYTQAVLYCSTSDWAFGPVFYGDDEHDAFDRAHMFCKWLNETGHKDPRE